jgi:uncharacterized OB-fold protein
MSVEVLGSCPVERGVQGIADDYRAVMEEHRVPVAQRCDECSAAQFPPLLGCRSCLSARLSWVSCGDRGVVGTFVTVHTAETTPSMSIPRRLLDKVPYSSVFVAPDDLPGVRLVALMLGPQQERLAVGLAVRLDASGGAVVLAEVV